MVCGLNFMVYGSWFTVHRLLFCLYLFVHGLWFMVFGLGCREYGSWFSIQRLPSPQTSIAEEGAMAWVMVPGLWFIGHHFLCIVTF